jgi:hypothetical protein
MRTEVAGSKARRRGSRARKVQQAKRGPWASSQMGRGHSMILSARASTAGEAAGTRAAGVVAVAAADDELLWASRPTEASTT